LLRFVFFFFGLSRMAFQTCFPNSGEIRANPQRRTSIVLGFPQRFLTRTCGRQTDWTLSGGLVDYGIQRMRTGWSGGNSNTSPHQRQDGYSPIKCNSATKWPARMSSGASCLAT